MTSEAPRTLDSFNDFFRARRLALRRRLMNYARSRGIALNECDADGVVSVAFTEMANEWPQVRDPDGYMWDRVGMRFIDYLRAQKKEEVLCDPSTLPDPTRTPRDNEPEAHVLSWDTDRLIEELPEREQKILRMHQLGYSKQEQADELNVSCTNAGVILYRAKKKLRDQQEGRRQQR